jgi:hypothetical protein
MNRKATLGLLVSCLLFLLAGGSGFAQKAEQKAAPKAAEKKPSAPKWTKLADDVQVLRLWNTTGPESPQIAILRLSEAEYAKFEANPKDYVNDHHIYPKDVNDVFIGHMPRYEKPKAKGDDDMIVTMMHHPIASHCFALSSEAKF